MKLTEKESSILMKRKEEICGLTNEILDIQYNPKQMTDIKKKMMTILSLIGDIVIYSKTEKRVLELTRLKAERIFHMMEFFKSSDYWDEWSETVPPFIEDFCIFVTSIDFNSTKGDIEIINPEIEISLVKIEKI